jgi:hypothetical protein
MSEGPSAALCNTNAHTSAPTRQIIELVIRQSLPSHSSGKWFHMEVPHKNELPHTCMVLKAETTEITAVSPQEGSPIAFTFRLQCLITKNKWTSTGQSRHISGFFYSRQKRFYEWNVWRTQTLFLGKLATKWQVWSQPMTLTEGWISVIYWPTKRLKITQMYYLLSTD